MMKALSCLSLLAPIAIAHAASETFCRDNGLQSVSVVGAPHPFCQQALPCAPGTLADVACPGPTSVDVTGVQTLPSGSCCVLLNVKTGELGCASFEVLDRPAAQCLGGAPFVGVNVTTDTTNAVRPPTPASVPVHMSDDNDESPVPPVASPTPRPLPTPGRPGPAPPGPTPAPTAEIPESPSPTFPAPTTQSPPPETTAPPSETQQPPAPTSDPTTPPGFAPELPTTPSTPTAPTPTTPTPTVTSSDSGSNDDSDATTPASPAANSQSGSSADTVVGEQEDEAGIPEGTQEEAIRTPIPTEIVNNDMAGMQPIDGPLNQDPSAQFNKNTASSTFDMRMNGAVVLVLVIGGVALIAVVVGAVLLRRQRHYRGTGEKLSTTEREDPLDLYSPIRVQSHDGATNGFVFEESTTPSEDRQSKPPSYYL